MLSWVCPGRRVDGGEYKQEGALQKEMADYNKQFGQALQSARSAPVSGLACTNRDCCTAGGCHTGRDCHTDPSALVQWPPSAGSRAEMEFSVRQREVQDADGKMVVVEVLVGAGSSRCYAVSIRGKPLYQPLPVTASHCPPLPATRSPVSPTCRADVAGLCLGGLNKFQQLVVVAALLDPGASRGTWKCLNRVWLPRSLLATAGKAQRARTMVAGVRLPEVLDRGLAGDLGWTGWIAEPRVGAVLPMTHDFVPVACPGGNTAGSWHPWPAAQCSRG